MDYNRFVLESKTQRDVVQRKEKRRLTERREAVRNPRQRRLAAAALRLNEMEVFPEAHEKRLRREHSGTDTGASVLPAAERPPAITASLIYCRHASVHVMGLEMRRNRRQSRSNVADAPGVAPGRLDQQEPGKENT